MLFGMFMKKRIVGTLVTALSIIFLIVVMGVCQFFTVFDANAETARILQMHSSSVFAMRKGYLDKDDPTHTVDTSRLIHVYDEDIAAFREAGYEGNIYPLYNIAMNSCVDTGASWALQTYRSQRDKENYASFYCITGLGVLQTTEQYLINLYGKDGGLQILSGEIDREGAGLVVTDYFADSILVHNASLRASPAELAVSNGDKYFRLTDRRVLMTRYRIAAVIDTGYAERYGSLLELWKEGKGIADDDADADLLIRFYNELNDGLNVAYTFNPNYLAVHNADPARNFAFYGEGVAEIDGKPISIGTGFIYPDKRLKDGEVRVRSEICAQALGIPIGDIDRDAVIGKKIKLSLGDLYAESYNIEKEFTVADIFDSSTSGASFYFSPDEFREAQVYTAYAYALYFDNVESAMRVYERGAELGFTVQSPLFSAMHTVAQSADVFVGFFDIIIWVLYALVGLTLAGFAAGSVKKCIYEIGVLRALGAKIRDFVLVFVLQMILVSVAVCLLGGLGLWLGAGMCNAALAEGFAKVTKNAVMRELRFISFSWTTVFADACVVFGLVALCATVPILLLRRVKPREIIRAKE